MFPEEGKKTNGRTELGNGPREDYEVTYRHNSPAFEYLERIVFSATYYGIRDNIIEM